MTRGRLAVLGWMVVIAGVPMVSPARAAPCGFPQGAIGGRTDARGCPAAAKAKPHDPAALRLGRMPGFVDLGNGTEVRVGGRARMEYDLRGRR